MTKRLTEPSALILASRSPIRARLLAAAGLSAVIAPTKTPETEMLARWRAEGADADTMARGLARAKAAAGAESAGPTATVIAADQILWVDDGPLEAAPNRAIAIQRLKAWSGASHHLVSGVVVQRGDVALVAETARVRVVMAAYDDATVDAYAGRAGDALTATVGGYEIEGLGAALIDRIEGDYFAALGLPLWPVLRICRKLGHYAL